MRDILRDNTRLYLSLPPPDVCTNETTVYVLKHQISLSLRYHGFLHTIAQSNPMF